MVLEHSFADARWILGLGVGCAALGLALLALLVRRDRPGWERALLAFGLAACCTLTGLSLRDGATKVARVRLETQPPRLLLLRRWPGSDLELGPGELAAIGIVSLGADPARPGSGARQLLFGPRGSREIRSFVEKRSVQAEELAERIASSFGLELQRFAGPPGGGERAGRPLPE